MTRNGRRIGREYTEGFLTESISSCIAKLRYPCTPNKLRILLLQRKQDPTQANPHEPLPPRPTLLHMGRLRVQVRLGRLLHRPVPGLLQLDMAQHVRDDQLPGLPSRRGNPHRALLADARGVGPQSRTFSEGRAQARIGRVSRRSRRSRLSIWRRRRERIGRARMVSKLQDTHVRARELVANHDARPAVPSWQAAGLAIYAQEHLVLSGPPTPAGLAPPVDQDDSAANSGDLTLNATVLSDTAAQPVFLSAPPDWFYSPVPLDIATFSPGLTDLTVLDVLGADDQDLGELMHGTSLPQTS